MIKLIIICFVVSLFRTQFFAGDFNNHNQPRSLTAFPDVLFDKIVISSSDFNCIEENSCTFLSEE